MNSGNESAPRLGGTKVFIGSGSPSLPAGRTLAGMAISFHGEVWTDARGQATVSLPHDAFAPRAELEYALHTIDGESAVQVLSELREGRFAIATDQPHVKVAWRISCRKEEST